jgi:hypothetical protein
MARARGLVRPLVPPPAVLRLSAPTLGVFARSTTTANRSTVVWTSLLRLVASSVTQLQAGPDSGSG